jgi:hypothetical protein
MLSHKFNRIRTKYLPLLVGCIKPLFLFVGLALYLAAFSMPVIAEQVKPELTTKSQPTRVGADGAALSTSAGGQLDRDTRQDAASYECTTIAGRETAKTKPVHKRSLAERLDKNRGVTKFSCLVSPIEVHEQWTNDKVLLIDVRRSSEYERFRIPGSLNLAPFAIKSKAFLKNKNIVLVNEGRSL